MLSAIAIVKWVNKILQFLLQAANTASRQATEKCLSWDRGTETLILNIEGYLSDSSKKSYFYLWKTLILLLFSIKLDWVLLDD